MKREKNLCETLAREFSTRKFKNIKNKREKEIQNRSCGFGPDAIVLGQSPIINLIALIIIGSYGEYGSHIYQI